jgi:MoaA/NifB/PqqE/SkfB family radical SAM enzyme
MLELASAIAVQGFFDELSATHAIGWVRDKRDPAARLAVTLRDAAGQTLAQGVADQPYAGLADGIGDGHYGFALRLPPGLPAATRASLTIAAAGRVLPRAGALQGYVNQRSVLHAAGWVRDRFAADERLTVEAVLDGEVIATGLANRLELPLLQHEIGDARYGFMLTFAAPLTEAARDALRLRVRGIDLPLSPDLVTAFELLSHAAIDIVNNCNLRCPFCLFDYAHTRATRFMTDEVFDAAMRLLPLVPKGGFWLSCLHEPSLHPQFLDFIARVPAQYRDRLMFTTNIAKKANDAYFAALAHSGAYHINISIESRTPEIYEKFRKGARYAIFKENWDRLIAAWRAAPAPPLLRYIIMGYRTNLAEIPDLVRYLRAERLPWHIEVRYTYDEPHIAPEFRAEEFLDAAQWAWLTAELSIYPVHEVSVLTPDFVPREHRPPAPPVVAVALPEPAPPAEPVVRVLPPPPWWPPPARPGSTPGQAALPLNVQMRWDGSFLVSDKWDEKPQVRTIAQADIRGVPDPLNFLMAVAVGPRPQGYIDEIAEDFVAGWIYDDAPDGARVTYEVVLRLGAHVERLGQGRADLKNPALGFVVDDVGFRFTFPRRLHAAEREGLEIWPLGVAQPLLRAPFKQGFVNARSCHHVGGWVRDPFDPEARLAFEVFIAKPGQIERLGEGVADLFSERLAKAKRGDACYAFDFRFPRELSPEERDAVVVRVVGERAAVGISPILVTS